VGDDVTVAKRKLRDRVDQPDQIVEIPPPQNDFETIIIEERRGRAI
jgi:hypothetical protein